MVFLGFHASHEQIPPSRLLDDVVAAEAAGFDGAMCSDHVAPWGVRQGESGFALSWLGAALARTAFSIGFVNAPGQRYHPVVVAQAYATLEEMFPGRFWAALGSGEAMNEHVTGEPWPPKHERNERLAESVSVIRRLLNGDMVDHDGLVRVHEARLWTLPETPPPLFATAVSPETAGWAASWADGLATVLQPPDALHDVVSAYRSAGGAGPCILQVHLSWAETDAEALAIARDQWSNGVVGPPEAWNIEQPEQFDAVAGQPEDHELREALFISPDLDELAERIAEHARIGFDRVYLHHVGKDQAPFLQAARKRLLPRLRELL
ncbi:MULTISPECIES: TIGR03885 family FMN-dependent LLM class oxidoreductase [Microbacterium]|uniref:TIGR03885 family FMN-dependent LLM class oxidoreductase n=1 Tax=Microbacterium wangchenii TaxID=2541726 RepID=A0ABX5SUU6_9MICO|nr:MULTISPECIES: TIGR03885 family FMN-dependent LLM class oxidoreductase [Microbacterium]MCK6067485.1 TIGR03885 family FMN-dependent LLM class oxidoreductase [Microbacterium sp. EYE_512]QBR89582.1 TIGR03885 family FMN-dependent LLM class oxidoreductase [Microbacterium wangchenii]TXK16820.1 TIGR03885 family FMN-dependent LLM class oxidoreductase [Microbacterium wangchenii]